MKCLLHSENQLIADFQQQLTALNISSIYCNTQTQMSYSLTNESTDVLIVEIPNFSKEAVVEKLASIRDFTVSYSPIVIYVNYNRLSISNKAGDFHLTLPLPKEAVQCSFDAIKGLTKIQKDIDQQQQHFYSMLKYSHDGMISIDNSGIIRFISPTIADMFLYSTKELVGMQASKLLTKKHHRKYNRIFKHFNPINIDNLLGKEQEIIGLRKNHDTFPLGITFCISSDKPQQLITVIIRDLSDKKELEEKIDHLENYDHLTDLPNRELLFHRIENTLVKHNKNAETLAVLHLDLDRFKIINETRGHHIGDKLLHKVSKRLSQCIKKSDTLARTGGDVFIVVLEHLNNIEEAADIANTIFKKLVPPFKIDGNEFYITTSIGITSNYCNTLNADNLLQNADIALYKAKEKGRNTYAFYSPEENTTTLHKSTLETALHTALANNELEIYYQPQINISTGQVIGAEALLRWNNPSVGFVSPMEFIPLLEDSGLIVPVGNWILEESCRQWQSWIEDDLLDFDSTISVNLSARQFNGDALVKQVNRALIKSNLASRNLVLEITESIIMNHTDHTKKMLEAIKKNGVSISLDDFGTGYSSLSYLTQFPIDHLKIDRSFLMNILDSAQDAALASAIIRMAQSLSLEVVAEGVDSEEKLEFLRQRHCHYYQGFLYAKPLPANEFIARIQENRFPLIQHPI
jgi:diguanylate cyclase (GGDEF)-like protein/PAS domain S-box-containing protein